MNRIFSFICIVLILYIGRPLLLPIITAVFLWYLTIAIAAYYRKVIRSKFWSDVLAGSSLLFIFYIFMSQIQPTFIHLYAKMPEITAGTDKILAAVSKFIGMKISFPDMPSLEQVLGSVVSSIASIGAAFGMILIYMIFIFFEQNTFNDKIKVLFPSRQQLSKINYIISSIDSQMKKYLFVKTGISLATAIFSYIWLSVLGVDFALTWSFLMFILNYIPTFGSIFAVALPTVYSFALTGGFKEPLMVMSGLAVLQIIFGNILDPKLTGKTLNLSTLAILINLVFWGMLWGAVGMFFSVPILVGAFVVCAQFDKTRWIAVLLSADGEIPNKNED